MTVPANGGRKALLFLLAVLAVSWPGLASAQRVERQGAADVALDRRLGRMLASGRYMLVSSDTFVGPQDTIPQDVLVLDAALILEGTVRGDIVAVDGNVFVRPSAKVTGDVVNIAGGLYQSMNAHVGGHIIDLPDAPYHVVRTDDVLRIVARAQASRIKLDSRALGIHAPAYDRVAGLTAAWGASLALPLLGPIQPTIHGWVGYQTQRGEPVGGVDMGIRMWAYEIRGGVERFTFTNDGWNRRAGYNSVTYLWNGSDYRNYYAADRRYISISRELGDVEKRFHATLRVGVQLEDASSVAAGDPWHVVGPIPRPNPAIDGGRIASGIAALDADWISTFTRLNLGGQVEAARTVQGGQYHFDRFETWGTWAMKAIANQTLEVRWRFMGPLPGTDSLPRQRWVILGGAGTLPVFDVAEFQGDRLAFVHTRYLIPLPRWLALPVVGAPDLELVDAIGRAWTVSSAETRLEQNIGGGLAYFGAYVRYMVDARDTSRGAWIAGLVWPFAGRYPWQQRR